MRSMATLGSMFGAITLVISCSDASDGAAISEERASECPEDSLLGYDNFGGPFMFTWCTGCHASAVPEGSRQGAPLDMNFDDLESIRLHRARIEERAGRVGGTMPPAGGPGDDERAQLLEWLACGAPGDGLSTYDGAAASTTGSSSAGGAIDCTIEATTETCASCCDEEQAAGYDAFLEGVFLHCACAEPIGTGGTGGLGTAPPCQAQCDTAEPATDFCPASGRVSVLDPRVNVDCYACVGQLDGAADCRQQAIVECQQDAACHDWMACVTSCASN
jgi:hypothetical protein